MVPQRTFQPSWPNLHFDAGNSIILLEFWSCCLRLCSYVNIQKHFKLSHCHVFCSMCRLNELFHLILKISILIKLEDTVERSWNQHWKRSIQEKREMEIENNYYCHLFTQVACTAMHWGLLHLATNGLGLMDGTDQFCIFYWFAIWIFFYFNRLASFRKKLFLSSAILVIFKFFIWIVNWIGAIIIYCKVR